MDSEVWKLTSWGQWSANYDPGAKSHLFLFLCDLRPKYGFNIFKWLQKWPQFCPLAHKAKNSCNFPIYRKSLSTLGQEAMWENRTDFEEQRWSCKTSLSGCHLRTGCFPPPKERKLGDSWRQLKILRLVHQSSVPWQASGPQCYFISAFDLAKETY